ncbi:MAG: hypothetical protein ACFE8B_12295 [Candidatus Hermodarchaeota archaeon]
MENNNEIILMVLIAGILGIVSIFIPAWGSSGFNAYVWFWNLILQDGEIDFIETGEPLYNIGIGTTIILVIGTAILLFMGIFAKLKEKRVDILGIIGGALLIIAPIVFFAGAESEYSGFFSVYELQPAILLPFVGGALGIFAGIKGIMEKRG